MRIELSLITHMEGMHLYFDFNANIGDSDIITSLWKNFAHKDSDSKFVLGFNDNQELAFETSCTKECFEWMQSIYLIKSNIHFYEKLPFIKTFKDHKAALLNRI